MTRKRKRTDDVATWTEDELREAGVPYLVNPETLTALGLDPDEFLQVQGAMAGWVLDRDKHRDIIRRVQALEPAPSGSMQAH